jgi:crossover junction endodeoxyribonuclease RuvC
MRVIGVDPGTTVTGYGVVDVTSAGRLSYVTSGAIATPSRSPLGKRLKMIYDQLISVFETHRPSAVVIEDTFLAKNFQAALKLGQARGMALLAAEMCDIPVYEYTPTQVKMAVVGYGVAQKEQVQLMVERLLRDSDRLKADLSSATGGSHHATDALACAICHLHSVKMKKVLTT